MSRAIVSLDTDRIKQYVFKTGTLKDIRGASAILDELNRKDTQELVQQIDPSAECIYANGGSGMFEVERCKAQACIQAVENCYQMKTLTASITGAEIPLDTNTGFDKLFKALSFRLRAAKEGKDAIIGLVTHPLLRTCDSCGEEYSNLISEGELLCRSCFNKRQKDAEVKQSIEQLLKGERLPEEYKLWDKLILQLSQNPDNNIKGKKRPEDLETLSKLSRPSGYIGLLYADGNGIGPALEKLNRKEEFRMFSKVVDDGIYHAMVEAIQTHLNTSTDSFPFDILLLGGDDLVMVTVAHKAIEAAITIGEAFQNFTKEKLSTPLSLSFGVAIAHAKFPFGNLLELAEDLLRFAKREGVKRARQWGNGGNDREGLINFQVVSGRNSLNFTEDYKGVFVDERKGLSGKEKLFRTLRPYEGTKMKNLLDSIREFKFKSFPRNKLQALQEAVFQDLDNSRLQTIALINRLKEKDQKQMVYNTLTKFSGSNAVDFIPWFRQNRDYYTPFWDIAEIFDFIQ